MLRSTVLDLAQEEQAQMLVALRAPGTATG
jgi:hypothetical protein